MKRCTCLEPHGLNSDTCDHNIGLEMQGPLRAVWPTVPRQTPPNALLEMITEFMRSHGWRPPVEDEHAPQ